MKKILFFLQVLLIKSYLTSVMIEKDQIINNLLFDKNTLQSVREELWPKIEQDMFFYQNTPKEMPLENNFKNTIFKVMPCSIQNILNKIFDTNNKKLENNKIFNIEKMLNKNKLDKTHWSYYYLKIINSGYALQQNTEKNKINYQNNINILKNIKLNAFFNQLISELKNKPAESLPEAFIEEKNKNKLKNEDLWKNYIYQNITQEHQRKKILVAMQI